MNIEEIKKVGQPIPMANFVSFQINEAITHKDGQQRVIESYKADVAELDKALDSIGKKLDSVEHGQGVLCPAKANTLKTISDTLDRSIQEPLELLQSKAVEVKQMLSNLDSQFVDEQVINT